MSSKAVLILSSLLIVIASRFSIATAIAAPLARSGAAPLPDPLVWDSPSADAAGSMPMGNGEVGINAWCEPSGEVRLLLSRTDTFSEICRLLKVGLVSIRTEPALDTSRFVQTLDLAAGRLTIQAGGQGAGARLSIFVDPDAPIVHVTVESDQPRGIHVQSHPWRTTSRIIEGEEANSAWTMRGAPEGIALKESADVHYPQPDALLWYHRNETSVVPLSIAHQGLEGAADALNDPLLNRTFGAMIMGSGFIPESEFILRTARPATRATLRMIVPCAQHDSVTEFLRETRTRLIDARSAERAAAAAEAWWRAFWERSWIVTSGFPEASRLNEALALQRWVQACGGRGEYPIKFNGSIFTVAPGVTGGPEYNHDWRRWGDCFWWQNTRLPYYAMLASGDWEMMDPLFRLYQRAIPIARERSRIYHGVKGAYFPETMTMFGLYSNNDYGWTRQGHAPSDVLCPWWQWAWNSGLELIALMLDRDEYSPDESFRRDVLVPSAEAVLEYFDTRFERDGEGMLRITPTQAVETHWHGVINDMPCIAGLHNVLPRLKSLAAPPVSPTLASLCDRLTAALPPIPVRAQEGRTLLSPAQAYDASRQNCETPELYALFPFNLIGPSHPLRGAALAAYEVRHDRATHGWTQDGQFAALLGLTAEAKANVLAKIANNHPRHRFPAIWGPNFDWLPDQCHGSNLLTVTQLMLLQAHSGELHLLPAWPKDWNVSFRLHAPGARTVECEYRDGSVLRHEVIEQCAPAPIDPAPSS